MWQTPALGSYTHHIVDYGTLGFRSGLLPGSIYYGLFGENASVKSAAAYDTVLILIFFLAASVLLERFMNRVSLQYKTAALIISLVLLSGPFTFAVYTDELGMLDVYFLFFSIIFFFVFENKILRFVVPAVFVLLAMTHMSSVISYMVLLGTLMLYRISTEEDPKQKKSLVAVFALSMVAAMGISVYFLAFKKDIPITVEQFNQIAEQRGGKYFSYYDYILFDRNYYTGGYLYPEELYEIENPVWRALSLSYARIKFLHTEYLRVYMTNFAERVLRFAVSVILLSPLMAFYYKKMYRLFRSIENNKLFKFSVFLMMVQFPFTFGFGYLFSVDIIRWFAHSFLISFTMLLYVMYRQEDFRNDVLSSVDSFRQMPATWIYLLAYSLVNFSAYS